MKSASIYHVKHKPVTRRRRGFAMPTQFTTTIQDTSDGITPIHRYRIYMDCTLGYLDIEPKGPYYEVYPLFVVINGERHDINWTLLGLVEWYLDWTRYQLF